MGARAARRVAGGDDPHRRGARAGGHAAGTARPACLARAHAHRARFVVVDGGEDVEQARRAGSARCGRRARWRRRPAAATSRWRRRPRVWSKDRRRIWRSSRRRSIGSRRPVARMARLAARARRRSRALHHRRRRRRARSDAGRRRFTRCSRAAPNVAIMAFGARPATAARPPARPTCRSPTTRQRRRRSALTVTRGASVIWSTQPSTSPPAKPSARSCRCRPTAVARLRAPRRGARRRAGRRRRSGRVDRGRGAVDVTVVTDDRRPLALLFRADPRRASTFVEAARLQAGRDGRRRVRSLAARPSRPAGPRSSSRRPSSGVARPARRRRARRALDRRPAMHPVVAGVDPLTVDVKTRLRAMPERI